MWTVGLAQVLCFRARASGLDGRRHLPAGGFRGVAYGGLQDTIPRGALTALHARLEGVKPASWDDPSLCQIWFRGADYVVPREDFGVFTLGGLPRQRERAALLEATALAVCDTLAGEPRDERDLASLLPAALRRRGLMHRRSDLRFANVAGRYRIRWDARRVTVIPTERPEIDPAEARIELARHFLGWHGPATSAQFAKWAGVPRQDAAETWTDLGSELISVKMPDQVRHLLSRDEESLLRARPVTGVRFILRDDPYLALDRPLVDAVAAAAPPPIANDSGAPITPRLINSLVGRILVEGTIVGRWGRAQNRLTIHLWEAHRHHQERVRAEAETFVGPIGRPMHIRWLH